MLQHVKSYRQAPWHIPDTAPAEDWPQAGNIQVNKYSTRYRPHLDVVLKDLSFQIQQGEKVTVFLFQTHLIYPTLFSKRNVSFWKIKMHFFGWGWRLYASGGLSHTYFLLHLKRYHYCMTQGLLAYNLHQKKCNFQKLTFL